MGDGGAQLSRRSLVRGAAAGLGALAFGGNGLAAGSARGLHLLNAAAQAADPMHPRAPHFEPRAKRIIYLHMAGSPSQLDLFDHKPKLDELDGKPVSEELIAKERFAFIKGVPKILASPYAFSRHGESGQLLSELLPHLGGIADEICIVRSMVTHQFNHAPAQILMNTGHERIGRPSMGSWLDYGLGSENQNLPAYVVLDDPKGLPVNHVQNWQSGWLPPVYQGTRVRSEGSPLLNLKAEQEYPAAVLDLARSLRSRMDSAHREQRPGQPQLEARITNYELAARMQLTASDALDVSQEKEATREMYGLNDDRTASYGKRCLMARRLVERGVRLIQIYIKGQIWDNHSDLESALRPAVPPIETCRGTSRQPESALEAPGWSRLHQAGLLISKHCELYRSCRSCDLPLQSVCKLTSCMIKSRFERPPQARHGPRRVLQREHGHRAGHGRRG